MKQQEKTKRTRDRILSAAVEEFGKKSYEAASMNSICEGSNLSKGLVYHNFKSKDGLYLECVKICYNEMIEYLGANARDFADVRESLQHLLFLREEFFRKNPLYSNIFFHTILQPPKHLIGEIREIREAFDAFNMGFYRRLLTHVQLREGVTEDLALEYFSIFTEIFNEYFQRRVEGNRDYRDLIEAHEGKLSKTFEILLYGIAKEGT